jgi:predicted DNA-binding protein
MITMEIDSGAEAFLETMARDSGRTPALIAGEVVEDWLENQALLRLAEERKADLKAGRSYTIPWGKVKAEYGVPD